MGSTGPPPDVIEEWTARLAAAKSHRDITQQDAKEADVVFRETIQQAAEAGLSAPRIAEVVGLSTYRVYQIKNGRRT